MDKYPKPTLVVSKCLGFGVCRYNGATIRDVFIFSLKKHVNYGAICPEVEIGLGVPRDPIRIVNSKKNSFSTSLQPVETSLQV